MSRAPLSLRAPGGGLSKSEATSEVSTRQRPFWVEIIDGKATPTASPWSISDLDLWLQTTQLQPGFVCQVIWRQRLDCRHRHKNQRTPAETARFVKSLIGNLGSSLIDVGIDAEQPVECTEFASHYGKHHGTRI